MAKKKKKPTPTAAVAQPVVKSDSDYQGEDDARTMMRTMEIMGDPERHKRAMGHIKKQKRAIESLDDLKRMKQEKYGPKDEEGDDDAE